LFQHHCPNAKKFPPFNFWATSYSVSDECLDFRGENMRIVLNFLLVASFLLCASAISFAGSRGVNAREHREQQRINQGISSGELTRREARRLESGLARIRIDERFARADGNVTPRERARLQHELTRESRNIYRQKHDGQDRTP
jgi:hypothetical protein